MRTLVFGSISLFFRNVPIQAPKPQQEHENRTRGAYFQGHRKHLKHRWEKRKKERHLNYERNENVKPRKENRITTVRSVLKAHKRIKKVLLIHRATETTRKGKGVPSSVDYVAESAVPVWRQKEGGGMERKGISLFSRDR